MYRITPEYASVFIDGTLPYRNIRVHLTEVFFPVFLAFSSKQLLTRRNSKRDGSQVDPRKKTIATYTTPSYFAWLVRFSLEG